MFISSANGKHRQNIQFELRDHSLIIFPLTEQIKYSVPHKERVISLSRKEGGFGVAIKGGREHSLPILISKILRPDADRIKLYVGDAILKVNEVATRGLSREQAIELLRNSGNQVVLTVKHYREVASLLKKEEEASRSVELLFAYVLDLEEQRAFRLQPLNKDEMVVHCSDRSDREMWVKMILAAVQRCNDHKTEHLNRNLEEANKIHFMNWINKKCYFPWNRQRTLPLFLAFKASSVYQFDRPPISLSEFEECQIVYSAYQCSMQADTDCIDQCINLKHYVLETPHHCVRFSLSHQQSASLERAWSLCMYLSVITLSSKTFSVHYENKLASLTIDWNMGFALYDIASKEYVWKYGFIQYRCNSLDGLKVHIYFSLGKDSSQKGEISRAVVLGTEAAAKQLTFCINAFLASKSAAPFN